MINQVLADVAIIAAAQAELNSTTYPRFGAVMDKWGYEWEALKVTTEDNYILTTFHVTGKKGESQAGASQGSVLIQHGDLEDGASWLTNYETQPFHLKLVDAGYDVWIGNSRGTEYSWDHVTLDSAKDSAYWDWTWADMGLYDNVANIKAINAAAGVEKMFYIGYSQGTAQMHYGLAHLESSFHAANLHRVVQLAPCFVPHVPNWTMSLSNSTVMQFQQYGIYSFNGPNWDEQLKLICDNFDWFLCEYYKKYTGHQGQGVKSEQHWLMCGLTDRFQEWAPDWLNGVHETDLVDVSNIKQVPMTFFTATKDEVCQHKIANKYIPLIQAETTQIEVKGEGHLWFASYANTDWFMDNLIAQLQVPQSQFLQ